MGFGFIIPAVQNVPAWRVPGYDDDDWNSLLHHHSTTHNSVETNNYFGTNRISNIIRLMKIERIEYRILFAHQENIRILFEYLKIFEYSNIFE